MISPSLLLNFLAHTFFLLTLTLLASPSQAQKSAHNITLGSTLTPTGPNSSWLSPSGEFAFGFRPLETNSSEFLLAIWFVNTINKTTVWYANGDNPVSVGLTLQLTASNPLSFQDSTGQNIWGTDVNGVTHAAMLDTGNFVLYNTTGPVWQSFENPSDTILPSQVLQLGSVLTSRLRATDYSTGRFVLKPQQDGNLVFYTIALVSHYQYDSYWASNTVGNGTELVFNETGGIYFVLRNHTRFNVTSVQIGSASSFYQRATLDYDGVFRQYIYPKNNSIAAKGGWTNGWTLLDYLPHDICAYSPSSTGSGICGFNSYCKFSVNQPVDCECPQEYSFLDPTRTYKGCKPDFAAQSCDIDQSDQFEFVTVTDLDFPLTDYELYYSIDEDTCRQQCLTDCFCSVAVFHQGNCWKKKIPLSNGKLDSSVDRTLFLKVPKNNGSQPLPRSHNRWKKDKQTWILAGSVLLGSSVFANLLLVLAIVITATHCCWKRKIQKNEYEPRLMGQGPRFFTYKEIESATNNFSDQVGHGGSGVVYKGLTQDEANLSIAVKKIDIKLLDETEKEFTAEVQTIGQTFHKNLVRLLGFCNEGAHRLLIYEFMSRGSLNEFLFSETRPNWNHRFQVALGIARGLLYLHEECTTQIIYCDIKPQNILLNENLVPKISDFGLAKLLKTDQTRTNTGIRGTKGYVAPEWFKNVSITSKVDVYSFGVILLEIICCRRNVDLETENEEQMILAYWVNDCFRDGRLDLVVEGDEEATHDMKRVERFVKVALWCIQEEPSFRPMMLKVTQMLDGAVDIPTPPDPSSYMSSIQ